MKAAEIVRRPSRNLNVDSGVHKHRHLKVGVDAPAELNIEFALAATGFASFRGKEVPHTCSMH
jgi:hypothetical protein